MTKNVVCISPQQKIIDVKHIYEKDKFHHHIPVTENNKLIGMVSLIDFMYHIKGAGINDDNKIYSELKVKDIMSHHPHFLPIASSVEDAAHLLAKGAYHAIPIVDDTKKVVGIVSTADIIRFYLTNK
jgi:CBS domain-containing protein